MTLPAGKKNTRNRFAPFVTRIVEAYGQHCRPVLNVGAEYGYIVAAIKRIADMADAEVHPTPEARFEDATELICECIAAYPTDWHRQNPDRRIKRLGLLMSAHELDNKLIPIVTSRRKMQRDADNPWTQEAARLAKLSVVTACLGHAHQGGTPASFGEQFTRGGIPDLFKRRDAILDTPSSPLAQRLAELEANVARIWIGHPTLPGNRLHIMHRLAAGLGAIQLGFDREGPR